jgi:hypothetical protein
MLLQTIASLKSAAMASAKVGIISVPAIMLATNTIDEQTYVPMLWMGTALIAAFTVGSFVKGIKDDRKEKEERIQKLEVTLAALKTASDEARIHHQQICPLTGANWAEAARQHFGQRTSNPDLDAPPKP